MPPLLRASRRVEIERLLFATVSSQDSEVEWIELLLGKRKESVYFITFIIIIKYFVVLCYQCFATSAADLSSRLAPDRRLRLPSDSNSWERREQQESYH